MMEKDIYQTFLLIQLFTGLLVFFMHVLKIDSSSFPNLSGSIRYMSGGKEGVSFKRNSADN